VYLGFFHILKINKMMGPFCNLFVGTKIINANHCSTFLTLQLSFICPINQIFMLYVRAVLFPGFNRELQPGPRGALQVYSGGV